MNALIIEHLSKNYSKADNPAVNDISINLPTGHILALVGPSGCGKTTTLRLIAGLERLDSGRIFIQGKLAADETTFTPAEKRGVGMVFQDHALFPHLTVTQNVLFGLNKQPLNQAREKAAAMLKLVDMEHFSERYPYELSGGERQRVALARALAPSPALVLMDEPFSSLDADLRAEVREQVREILKSMQATAIFVTHDQEEALFMGDQLAVFRQGRIEQIGTPEEIYHASATRFVAEFMGDSNFLKGKVTPAGILTELGLLPQNINLPDGEQVEIALRADDVDFEEQADASASIIQRFFRGAHNVYRLRLPSGEILHASKPHTHIIKPGRHIRVFISAGHRLAVFHNEIAVSKEVG